MAGALQIRHVFLVLSAMSDLVSTNFITEQKIEGNSTEYKRRAFPVHEKSANADGGLK